VHFNIILQSTPRSSKWSLSSRFPIKPFYAPFLSPYVPRPSPSSWFPRSNNLFQINTQNSDGCLSYERLCCYVATHCGFRRDYKWSGRQDLQTIYLVHVRPTVFEPRERNSRQRQALYTVRLHLSLWYTPEDIYSGPWNRILNDEVTVAQLVKKFPDCYRTHRTYKTGSVNSTQDTTTASPAKR